MKPETQEKIAQALNSLDTVKQATVSDGFTQKVLQRLNTATPKLVPMRTVWAVAASIAILFAANVWVGVNYKKQEHKTANKEIQQVIGEYHLQDDLFGF
ncbi:MAG: hypothetical protein ACO1PI_05625 [Bacteroidota bacterium]